MKTSLLVIVFAGMLMLHPAYGSAKPDQTAAITRAIEVGLAQRPCEVVVDIPRLSNGKFHQPLVDVGVVDDKSNPTELGRKYLDEKRSKNGAPQFCIGHLTLDHVEHVDAIDLQQLQPGISVKVHFVTKMSDMPAWAAKLAALGYPDMELTPEGMKFDATLVRTADGWEFQDMFQSAVPEDIRSQIRHGSVDK
jgi:hypothetical protein